MTDYLLVNRDGTTSQFDMSETVKLQDDDLLLVNRSGTTYTVTGETIKNLSTPPEIESASVTKTSSGPADFTSQIYTGTATCSDISTTPLTYGLKGVVSGTIFTTFSTGVVTATQQLNNKTNFYSSNYTGNSTADTTVTTGIKPGLVWIKGRANGYDNFLFDVTRGTNKALFSNNPNGDTPYNNTLTAFLNDGFNLGTDAGVNLSGITYRQWAWSCAENNVVNTNGDTQTTVARDVAGNFSIIRWTGTGASTSIGHGLPTKPIFIMFKQVDSSGPWTIWHSLKGKSTFYRLTAQGGFTSTDILNEIDPTDSLIYLGTNTRVNAAGSEYLAYCWDYNPNTCRVGTYVGMADKGDIDVQVGFKPEFMLVALSEVSEGSSGIYEWTVMDDVENERMFANSTTGPADRRCDFKTNGIKTDTTTDDASLSMKDKEYLYFAYRGIGGQPTEELTFENNNSLDIGNINGLKINQSFAYTPTLSPIAAVAAGTTWAKYAFMDENGGEPVDVRRLGSPVNIYAITEGGTGSGGSPARGQNAGGYGGGGGPAGTFYYSNVTPIQYLGANGNFLFTPKSGINNFSGSTRDGNNINPANYFPTVPGLTFTSGGAPVGGGNPNSYMGGKGGNGGGGVIVDFNASTVLPDDATTLQDRLFNNKQWAMPGTTYAANGRAANPGSPAARRAFGGSGGGGAGGSENDLGTNLSPGGEGGIGNAGMAFAYATGDSQLVSLEDDTDMALLREGDALQDEFNNHWVILSIDIAAKTIELGGSTLSTGTVLYRSPAQYGEGYIYEVDVNNNIVRVYNSTSWTAGKGSQAGAPPTQITGGKLYLVLNGNGDVSDLTSLDPGFVQQVTNSTASESFPINFPAVFPNGKTPDESVTSAQFCIDIQVSNRLSTDTLTHVESGACVNEIVRLFADVPADVATYNSTVAALNSYETDRDQFKSTLRSVLETSNYTEDQISSYGL